MGKPLKSIDLSRLVNNGNEPAETTSSGDDEFHVTKRAAKLTLKFGKSLKLCPRVAELRTVVKNHQTTVKTRPWRIL